MVRAIQYDRLIQLINAVESHSVLDSRLQGPKQCCGLRPLVLGQESVSDQTRSSADAVMVTKLRDARFAGKSRSPNIVPFHMLGIVSYCAIVTLIFNFKKCRDLEIRVRGHLRSLKVEPFDRLHMVSY